AERICAKSASLPILTNILLTAEKNKLEISATDLEVGVKYSILAKNEKEGSLAVAPKALSQFVGLIPEPQVLLLVKEDQLEIQSREFKADFKGLNPEEFPIIPSLKGGEESVEVETASLCQGLASVAGFTGQTQARPEISGVLFSFQKKILKLASTDSFRLAEKTLHLKKETGAEKSFILPQKAARELVSILGDRSGRTAIFFSPSQAIFDYSSEGQPQEPAIRLVSRLIEGEYPPYQDVIPAKHTTTALVNREELLNHIRAASLFSGRMSDVRVTVNPAQKQVELGAKSADIGENTSRIQGAVAGAKVSAAFNWRFLGEGISQMKSKDIELLFSGEEGPALLRPSQKEDEGFLYVVMPIKA
ncbi:MAG: DNA polymerase III subunit beta, partial [Candidatus Wildermuthbacteria bacterium]|nr:DNA polymerase III subunit beta [Candidatus Wildermuthbacteria bacterium]